MGVISIHTAIITVSLKAILNPDGIARPITALRSANRERQLSNSSKRIRCLQANVLISRLDCSTSSRHGTTLKKEITRLYNRLYIITINDYFL